jgi:hypothetical protein
MRLRLRHAPRVARRTHAPAFAGKGQQKAMRKNAALEVSGERFAHIRLWRVVVAQAVVLACTGKIQPSLVMLGHRLVQQLALGVARVVEFGFG